MVVNPQTVDAVLRIGNVTEVSGRKVFVSVDRNKNVSDLFFDGGILRNVSVNSYVEIRKGFLSLIGKVEGEKIEENSFTENKLLATKTNDKNKRVLTIALVGFIDKDGNFFGGTRELPLLGNEAYIVTSERIHQIHRLVEGDGMSVSFAKTDYEEYPIKFPIDGLFNSHIAIFGNTGSGKSNTLAVILSEFVKTLKLRNDEAFRENCRFLLFDFNGEYAHNDCITADKKVFNLSTRNDAGDKIPVSKESLLDPELLAILADATEKTQKPFLSRSISLFRHVENANVDNDGNTNEHFRNLLRQRVTQILQMSDKVRVDLLFDYLREVLPKTNQAGEDVEIAADLDWHNQSQEYKLRDENTFLKSNPNRIPDTIVYRHIENFAFNNNILTSLISYMYLQLISDVLSNRAQNEHIAPAINKLKSKRLDIEKVLDTEIGAEFWEENFAVINLNDVNLDMKKTIPLLISRKEYIEQKSLPENKSLSIIIDEAHNILSTTSTREAESWKDYRLETFEEIVKEGRKFGVFVTIASQRPNDISPTITSQAHNYFIHRLINQRDLATIASAVSYIDQLSEASIPTLPTGTCIFSGTAGQMPLKLTIDRLEENSRPRSGTLEFNEVVPRVD
jgi:DNA helicase HerA-like ATPase